MRTKYYLCYHLVLHTRQLVVLVSIVELAHLLTNSVILISKQLEGGE